MARRIAFLLTLGSLCFAGPAAAADVEGVVTLQGFAAFAGGDGGVPLEALRVRVSELTDATGPGVRCSVSAMTVGATDASGFFPASGPVSAGSKGA